MNESEWKPVFAAACDGRSYDDARDTLFRVVAANTSDDASRGVGLKEAGHFLAMKYPEDALRDRTAVQEMLTEPDDEGLLDTTALGYATLPKVDDVLASMPPPGERLSTGIPTLDRCSRGGFAPRRVYTLVGPPGKGKTALIVQQSVKAARDGALVVGLFVDEGSWQAAVMACEGLGFDRKTVEDNYGAVRSEVLSKTGDMDFYLPHPDDPDTVLDSVELWLQGRNPDRLVLVAGDSVQKLRVSRGEMPATPKERADSVMAAARRIADRQNAIVLLAAKANRASWAHKNPADNLDSLSAGMDSSSIEYDSDALFFMSGDPAVKSFLHVRKNRPGDGTTPTIALGFDRDRATFAEIAQDVAAAEEEKAKREKKEAAVREAAAELRQSLRKLKERGGDDYPPSWSVWRDASTGGHGPLAAARDVLLEDQTIRKVNRHGRGGGGAYLFAEDLPSDGT